MHRVFYYITLLGMALYTSIDYFNGNLTRSCLWLTISAVMIVAHEIKSSGKPVIYDNCTFITTTESDVNKKAKEQPDDK